MTEPIFQSSPRALDTLVTGLALNFFYGPIIALCCVVASEVLSALSGRHKTSFIPLEEKTVTQLKAPWENYGWDIVKAQVIFGTLFKLTGSGVNQVAIQWIKQNLSTPAKTLFCYFRVAVVAPVVEEIIFRGFLQERIHDFQALAFGVREAASKIHTYIRIAIQAICFGLAHYHPLQGVFNIYIVAATGLIGLYCGQMKESSGSVWESMSFHSLLNTSVTTRIWMFGA